MSHGTTERVAGAERQLMDRFWLTGWVHLYPPHTSKGQTARMHGEERLHRALRCVAEDGRRLESWPTWPTYLVQTPRRAAAVDELLAQSAARRTLLGVA